MKDMKKNCEITEEEKLNYEVKKIEFIIEEIKDTERRFSESIHEVIQVCQFFGDEFKTAKISIMLVAFGKNRTFE